MSNSSSTQYIKTDKKKINKELPELYSAKEECCGCSACHEACPTGAIIMKPDEEGFLYPCVDAEKCIACYKCLSACAFKLDQMTYSPS